MDQIQTLNTFFGGNINKGKQGLSHLYLTLFFTSCLFFWWLPSLYYCFVLNLPNPVSKLSLWASVLAASLYLYGYIFAVFPVGFKVVSFEVINGCEWISGQMTKFVFVPSLLFAVYFYISHSHEFYSDSVMPSLAQGLYYFHLFCGCMYLSTMRPQKHHKQSAMIAALLVILPRAIIALNFFRQFLAFAVLPIIFIAIARGWIRLTAKRIVIIFLMGACIFVVPSIFRGDFKSYSSSLDGENLHLYAGNSRMYAGNWLLMGSSLTVFDRFHTAKLLGQCSPLLVSLSEYIIPYRTFGICTVPFAGTVRAGDSNAIVTYMINGNGLTHGGTGATFLLDLYWFGGILAVCVGSLIMGCTCKFFVESMGHRSIFNGIWAECLMRSIFSIRGTYGFIYERIPISLLAIFLCVLVVRSAIKGSNN